MAGPAQGRPIASIRGKRANLDSRKRVTRIVSLHRPTYSAYCPFPPFALRRAAHRCDVRESLCGYARVRAIVRRACAARLFRSPLSELVVSDDPPRAAYDSNSSSSSSGNGSNGVSGREMRTSRSTEPRERERRGVGQPLRRTPWRGVGQTARARGRGGSGGHGGGWERGAAVFMSRT